MKIENVSVMNIDGAIRGMRNPLESWAKSDSYWTHIENPQTLNTANFEYFVGENDLDLMKRLAKAGSEHRKYLRQIIVSFDLTAPLYLYKELDTYKVGTVANSTSTMHKLANTPITLDCFEIDDFDIKYSRTFVTDYLIPYLEELRTNYLKTKDKRYWKELIRWLPESWLQTRTITLNYEVLLNIYFQRKNHKLTEWHFICNWIESLPYMKEIIDAIENGKISFKLSNAILKILNNEELNEDDTYELSHLAYLINQKIDNEENL